MTTITSLVRTALAASLYGLAGLGGLAQAHDTWFEATAVSPRTGEHTLALGTGNRFPAMETALGAAGIATASCQAADGRHLPLKVQAESAAVLRLAAPARAQTCWMQSRTFDVDITPDRVAVYLQEIQASAAVRASWAAMQQRGVNWHERYVKHARIELGPIAATTPAAPLAMDLQIVSNGRPLRAGDTVLALVTRDGQPLPDQALELRGDSSALGLWRRSDAAGRVQFTVPLAGRWIVRGTELRVSPTRPDSWDSRFLTLAFDVAPAGDQNGSSLSSKARSTNHASATAAISNDPAISTTRR